jgi:hypothetical protein
MLFFCVVNVLHIAHTRAFQATMNLTWSNKSFKLKTKTNVFYTFFNLKLSQNKDKHNFVQYYIGVANVERHEKTLNV